MKNTLESRKTTAKGQRSKQKILAAAVSLFKEKGFEETTIQDVCAISHIAVGTFYHYFHSKDDLVFAMVEDVNAEIERFYRGLDKVSYPQIVLKLFEYYVQIYEGYGPALITSIYRGSIFSGRNKFTLDRYNPTINTLRETFARGKNAGQFSADIPVDFFVETITSIFFQESALWCNHCDTGLFLENTRGKIERFIRLISPIPSPI